MTSSLREQLRQKPSEDRRLVNTTLTKRGKTFVDQLDDSVAQDHERQLGHLSETRLRTLIELLTLARTTE